MDGLLIAMLMLLLTGVLAWLAQGRQQVAASIAAVGNGTAVIIGLPPVFQVLFTAEVEPARTLPWSTIPGGAFMVQLDPLSAFFAIPAIVIPALAALFGLEAMQRYSKRGLLGGFFCFANVLAAGMILVLVARNAVLFLLAWEAIALAAYALIELEDEQDEVQFGGFVFLIATHVCGAFLFALFAVWKQQTGSYDFLVGPAQWEPMFWGETMLPSFWPSMLFLLALIGFGAKGGIAPFHVWMPHAYSAAPGHVSAVLSGAMSKLGVYGILRVLFLLGPQDANWNLQWGAVLIFLGVFSAIYGILNAAAQTDLRKLLAYSSVEHLGIITLGIGMGLLGRSLPLTIDGEATGSVIALLGFGGALLHVLNHSLFKSLLFMGSQAVVQATSTTNLNELGGLSKRLPWTTALFLIGGIAVCGLPPLNGFASEFLLYYGAVQEEVHATRLDAVPALAIIGGLAFIGGLATVAFTKAIGIGFLGAARSRAAAEAHEVGWLMRVAMLIPAVACVLIGLFAPRVVVLLQPVLHMLAVPAPQLHLAAQLREALSTLEAVVLLCGLFMLLCLAAAWGRWFLLAGREQGSTVTWDCGYAKPTPRMQYTASSFAQPVVRLFAQILHPRTEAELPQGLFPHQAEFATHSPDVVTSRGYEPLYHGFMFVVRRLRWLQHGHVHLYVLYIAVTIFSLLVARALGWLP